MATFFQHDVLIRAPVVKGEPHIVSKRAIFLRAPATVRHYDNEQSYEDRVLRC